MPAQEDYYTKWMNPTQQPKTTPQTTDYYNKWMGEKEVMVPTPMKPPTKPGDWKRELIGGLAYKAAKRSYDISTGKYMEPMKTKRYWIEAGKNLSKGVSHFLQAITGMPGRQEEEEARLAAMRGAVGEKRPPPAKVAGILGKEVGKMGFEFAAFLPRIGIALAVDPVKEVRDNPAGVGLFVFSIVGTAGGKIRARAKAGQSIARQDINKAIDSMPDSIFSKKQKAKIKQAFPEQIDLPFETAALMSPEQKVVNAIKKAKPFRKQQEVLYAIERAKRFKKAEKRGAEITGEKGFYAEKAELAGKLPKVRFESIRLKLTQAEVDSMFKQVTDSPALSYLETLPAREGLGKILGEVGGDVPTGGELLLLRRVFSGEFIKTIQSKRTMWEKIKPGLLEGANVPRALMASYDLSFGLRQGIFLATRYPKEFSKSFAAQFKLFGSEKAFKALKAEIASRPTYKLMVEGRRKLALTEMDSILSLREEAFMGAAWAEKIPLIGKGVRASNRAYTGFANKLRADVFDHLIKGAEKTGRNPWKEPLLVESIIDFVNAGSGRGALPKALEKAAVNLNTVLFSPRLIFSRLNLLSPRFYIKLDPFVRKQALQSLFAFTGMTATVLGLAKLSGAEVETDLRSADFAKIKIGDTRLDIMGGFQQYIRTAAQLISGTVISTTTGRVSRLGEGYKPATRATISLRALEYKLAPVASFAVSLFRGRTTFGEPINVPEEVAKRFVPMVIQDVIDLAKDDPKLLPLVTPGFFGVGIQTYGAKKKEGVVY